jgi:hypothetical protein
MKSQLALSRCIVRFTIALLFTLTTACGTTSVTSATPTAFVQDTSQTAVPTASIEGEAGHEGTDHAEDAEPEEGAEHAEDEEHAEGETHEEGGEHERLPNEDAVIHIVSPADGATFSSDEEIVVEIETESFVLGEEGRHWELYVDGASWGSIEGGNQDEVVRGLEPGEHEITAYLSLGSHDQLADGSTIYISVTE